MTFILCFGAACAVYMILRGASDGMQRGRSALMEDWVAQAYEARTPRIWQMAQYLPPAVVVKVAATPAKALPTLKKPLVDPVWEVQPIFFKSGEPRSFDEYNGQTAVISELRDAIAALRDNERSLPPQMFLGPAGIGKTLLAKVLANELQLRADETGQSRVYFFERLSYDIDTAEKLDEVIKQAEAHPGCVLFIDEIHGLPKSVATKLYTVLEEHRYTYQNQAIRSLAPFTLIGATTDYGTLDAPMQRRWVRHQLERSTPAQLLQTLERRSQADVPIEAKAAQLLVDRVKLGGAPWEAVRVYNLAATAAKAANLPRITEEVATMVLNRYGIDDIGLDRYDRACIKAILSQPMMRTTNGRQEVAGYRCSEDAVAAIAGVDKTYYRDTIRPKLMSRGLLIIRAGQQLTPKAVELYHDLLKEPV